MTVSVGPGGGVRGSSPAARRRAGFAVRLMIAQVLVLAAMTVTTWVVASVVGPGLFHAHLEEAGDEHTSAEVAHIEEAFASALLLSVTVALVAASAAALAVSWYFSRRVQRSIGTVTDAAAGIAAGRFHTRVPEPGLGHEFDTLADGYNGLAARLEAVETTRRRLLSDLAHEMRTPLATVKAHLEAVEDGVRDLDQETLTVLGASVGRLQRLADDVSAVSRAEEGNLRLDPTPVDLAEVARTVLGATRAHGRTTGVALLDDLEPGCHVVFDVDRLGQVITNLLDNALRHTPAGGTVTVSSRRSGADPRPIVELRVADTGEGIPAEHLPHVFDRFYRVDTARDRAHGGSGIGLAITRALVEAHGGSVTAHSHGAGTGATFVVVLPAFA